MMSMMKYFFSLSMLFTGVQLSAPREDAPPDLSKMSMKELEEEARRQELIKKIRRDRFNNDMNQNIDNLLHKQPSTTTDENSK